MASLAGLRNLSKFLEVSGVQNKLVETAARKPYIEVVEFHLTIYPNNLEWFDSKVDIYLSDDFSVIYEKTSNNFQEILKTVQRYKLIIDRDIEYNKDGGYSLYILEPRS